MAATFGWLCVETLKFRAGKLSGEQPPSGGCVLKHYAEFYWRIRFEQPPSGGCVLKQALQRQSEQYMQGQPPSGGCVLKQTLLKNGT